MGRHGVIVICNRNRLQSITVFQVIVIVIDYTLNFFEVIVIVIEYIKNVIVIMITFAITLASLFLQWTPNLPRVRNLLYVPYELLMLYYITNKYMDFSTFFQKAVVQ